MFDKTLLLERLQTALEIVERIPRRFAGISTPLDFTRDESGHDRMDAICMALLAAGEEFKRIDRKTEGRLFAAYPEVAWQRAMGLRDVLAHGYFEVDPGQLFGVCRDNIPGLIATLKRMIADLRIELNDTGTPA